MTFRADFQSCLIFWSRLPVRSETTPSPFQTAIRALPAAALLIALPAALALVIGRGFGFSPFLAGLISVGVLAATTGALHEDGLADCADAWGGSTPERRLEILKDSRIGAFGALALVFSVALRAESLAVLSEASLFAAFAGLLAAAVVSRVACLTPLALLPPARVDGLGASAGAPDSTAHSVAIVGAIVCAILPLLAGLSAGRVILALIAAFGVAFVAAPLARAKLGGQTGDVAGATQQAAEIVFLALLSTGASA